jgi:DNA-binding MarR family transcriptional regulator
MASATRQEPARQAPSDLATRLHSAAIHLLRRLRVEDVKSGLSGPRLSALSVVVFAGPITLGDLARAEQVRPPTMSRVVAALARGGLVSVTRDPKDRRVQRIRATARGRSLLEAGRTRRVHRLARDLAALDPDEYAKITDSLVVLERIARPDGPRSRLP